MVAYHQTFGMAHPHVAAMSYPHCDLKFSDCRSYSPELLRDGCQRSYLVQRNMSQVGAWVLRYIHSYSISCLPILEQNLRLYQKNQEVLLAPYLLIHTLPLSEHLLLIRGHQLYSKLLPPYNESSSLSPSTARIALHSETFQLLTTLNMIT